MVTKRRWDVCSPHVHCLSGPPSPVPRSLFLLLSGAGDPNATATVLVTASRFSPFCSPQACTQLPAWVASSIPSQCGSHWFCYYYIHGCNNEGENLKVVLKNRALFPQYSFFVKKQNFFLNILLWDETYRKIGAIRYPIASCTNSTWRNIFVFVFCILYSLRVECTQWRGYSLILHQHFLHDLNEFFNKTLIVQRKWCKDSVRCIVPMCYSRDTTYIWTTYIV